MIKSWPHFFHAVAFALAVCTSFACTSAHGQSNSEKPDLYLDAMRSLSEGRRQEAGDALTRMIDQEPQHAGAWLDLAIIQCELGRTVEAERMFRTIESRFSPPPGILEVIESHRASGCKGWQPRKQLSVVLARGADSNVNQGASSRTFSIGSGTSIAHLELLPEYLPQRDQYTLLTSDYTHDLTPGGSVGFLQFRARQNDSLSRYNTTSLFLGAEHPWNVGKWNLQGTGAFGMLTLGGQLYQRQGLLQLRVAPPLELPEGFQLTTQAGLTHVSYRTLSDFNSDTLELSSLLNYTTAKAQVQTGVGYLFDKGTAGRLGGNRHGWFASLQSRTRIYNDVIGELGLTHQRWLSEKPYSPGLIDAIRNQDTLLFRAALNVPLNPHHSLNIEWRQVRNNENISIFQYNSQLLQISWQWRNF